MRQSLKTSGGRIEVTEGKGRQFLDLGVERSDDLLEILGALNLQGVGGFKFAGGRISLEFAPALLIERQRDGVEGTASGNADLQRNWVAHSDRHRPRVVLRKRKITDSAVEGGGRAVGWHG